MGRKTSRPAAGGSLERSAAAVSKSVSNALREEAERDWAKSDRETAKGRRRKQTAAAKGRVGAPERGPESGPRKDKPAPAQRDRSSKAIAPAATTPSPRPARR